MGARLEYLQIPLVFGVGSALVTMLGTNVGAGRQARAERIAWTGAGMAAVLTGTIGLGAALAPRAWLGLFSADPEVLHAGATYLRIVGPELVRSQRVRQGPGRLPGRGPEGGRAVLRALFGAASGEAPFLVASPPEGLQTGGRAAELRDETMAGKAIRDLVGRVMIDKDFLAELVRDPDVILAGYELSAEERAVIMQALVRGAHGPEQERAHALQNVMLKRWAT